MMKDERQKSSGQKAVGRAGWGLRVALLICGFSAVAGNTNSINNNNNNTTKNQTMENKDYTTEFQVEQSPKEVFNAITNVKGWWSENVTGGTSKLNDEFFYNYKDVHACKMRLIEVVPEKKIVWLVLENEFNFTKDKSEWKGNTIVFEISEKKGKTQLTFTHVGLVPSYECFSVCQDAWTSYIQGSLKNLITTGKGNPNTKENDLNQELIKKWGLPDDGSIAAKAKQLESYSFSFTSSKSPDVIFKELMNIEKWWSGLFDESFKGKSENVNDEFTFNAGGGMHYSKQRLVEVIPGKKIVWQITESKLTFLKDPEEWTGSKISFELLPDGKNTKVIFRHEGLVPQWECYDNCSSAWTGYMGKLRERMK